MDKRILIALFLIILLAAASAGCFGKTSSSKSESIKFETVPGNYPPESGWLDSDMGDSPQHVDTTIPLDINVSEMVVEIVVLMTFEDFDAAHAESDDGSDPDEVTITLTDGRNTSTPATGITPCSLEIGFNATSEGAFMAGTWEIMIQATCNPGKPYTILPRPGLILTPLQYKDQGIAYTSDLSYSYMRIK